MTKNTEPQNSSAAREQHFYVATAKFAFNHPQHCIVFVRDPISIEAAAEYGLTPLTLYGLVPAGTDIPFIRFSAGNSPIPFLEMLQEAWKTAPGLRGCPDTLRVSRHVATASPGLAVALERIGVGVVIADGADKRFPTSLRNGQNAVQYLGMRFRADDPELASIEALNTAAMTHHQQWSSSRSCEARSDKDLRGRLRSWLSLPVKQALIDVPSLLDWAPGPWLSAWENNVPPAGPRRIADSFGVNWLLAGQSHNSEAANEFDDEGGEGDIGDDNHDWAARKAKLVVDCWPNEPLAIAKALGITARDLKWYLTGQAPLSNSVRSGLLALLGVEFDEMHDDYDAFGPCVLVARSLRSIVAAYDDLACGGDLEFSFEALPAKGAADPSWRYLVFKAYSRDPSVVMIPRGSAVAEQLTEHAFIGFQGQRAVAAEVYRDIVASCGRACASPGANIPEMEALAQRIECHLTAFDR